ncbi:MAG: FAD:protein FMN transferase [Candidatus Nanopelagicales bacterium]
MITVGINTWKTQLWLSVRATASPGLERNLRRLLRDEVSRLDALASRFRPDSELSAVNAAAGEWVGVSWGFVSVLTACLDAAQMTGGLVDPTLGRAVKAAGYDRWAQQTTSTDSAVHSGNWRGVGIRPGGAQAQVLTPAGTALDLGSVAKAWLADRLAKAVAASGYEVCANMGGDVRVMTTAPWTVWADPGLPGESSAPVDLTDAAVATSGVGHRRWAGGHHIIDPRTGRPADTQWWSVSAVAASAVHANAAATTGVILGSQGPAWLSAHGLDARFVSQEGVVTTGRWPSEVAA